MKNFIKCDRDKVLPSSCTALLFLKEKSHFLELIILIQEGSFPSRYSTTPSLKNCHITQVIC